MNPALIISLASVVVPLINSGFDFLAKSKQAAASAGTEWTEAERKAFEAEIEKLNTKPEEWQKPQAL